MIIIAAESSRYATSLRQGTKSEVFFLLSSFVCYTRLGTVWKQWKLQIVCVCECVSASWKDHIDTHWKHVLYVLGAWRLSLRLCNCSKRAITENPCNHLHNVCTRVASTKFSNSSVITLITDIIITINLLLYFSRKLKYSQFWSFGLFFPFFFFVFCWYTVYHRKSHCMF